MMTAVRKHRWGAGQSSSDAFVRNLGRMINRSALSIVVMVVAHGNVVRPLESEGRAIDFGDLVPLDCVLRRVSEELFNLTFPALSTWRVLRDTMATAGGSWSSIRSKDLPEGLSEKDEGSRSPEETPSVSGSSKVVGPEDSWITRSYLSKVVDVKGLDKYRRRYQIPEDVVLWIPESDEVACSSRYGDVAFYEADFNAGVRTVVGCMVMWKVLSDGKDDLTVDELLFCYKPCQIPASPGFWSLNMQQRGLKLVVGTPSSNREWKDDFVFVCGDNWEGLACEKDDNFIHIRREWGVPSFSALKRPKLDQDDHNRVIRALHHEEHHFKHFIRPELLALYSFGLEPRMATAKLNREKLKKMMSQQDEAPLTLGKKRKTDSSSKKVTDKRSLLPPPSPPAQKPSLPDPAPTLSVEIVEIPTEPSCSRSMEKMPTLPRDASLACRRAKSVVTKDDIGEYDKVNTDIIKVAGVHSLMKGLTELTVIANRCIQWEEVLLKDRVVGELSSLKVDMTRKDEDLRKALDGAKRADEQMKMLASQLEGARVSVVEEFKSLEAYDDNNTKYFLSDFSFLKKQVKKKYLELDFDAFQPFEDDESMMPADEGNVGTTSADPQMDDDATS
uniref:Uncharacterized protein n=1 Tax=Fagus sylvatica TaxID=28930 RepID=A0A2N9H9P7_FAGSY